MSRRRLWAITAALCVLALAAERAALARTTLEAPVSATDLRSALADLLAGAALAASGLAAWHRRPDNRTGPLLTAAAVAWFLGTLADSGVASIAAFGSAFVTLHRGPLIHAVLAYPTGRIGNRFGRVVAVAAWVTAAIPALGANAAVTLAVCALVLVAIGRSLLRSGGHERSGLLRAFATATAISAVLAAGAVASLTGAAAGTAYLTAYELVIACGSAWLAAGIIRPGWAEAALTTLVVQLGSGVHGSVESRVAEALGDPTLRVGYRIADHDGFVSADGQPIALPDGDGRQVTYLSDDKLAVVVHDRDAAGDPALLDAVAAAARIAVANARLQADVRTQVADLAASRRRIVEAADAQRQRFERELRAGAVAKLVAVQRALEACRSSAPGDDFKASLAETVGELERAREELGDFARGVRPPLLADGGLRPALADLARRAPVAVDLETCDGRFAPAVEAVAYFVCSEALANVAKYAHASSAVVTVDRTPRSLRVEVVDDGVGGARPSVGSGLLGLRDRVEALGGGFQIESAPGRGTRLEAVVPTG